MPAFGSPTSPMSAMSRNSSRSHRSSPGSPFCACLGAWWVEVMKWTLPSPPRPPRATSTVWSLPTRSAISASVASSKTPVPGGTLRTRSVPAFPWRLALVPRPPESARKWWRCWKSRRVVWPGSTRRWTVPPRPPSPPSGPPRGTWASRRNVAAPSPPSPPWTQILTRSRNIRPILARAPGRDPERAAGTARSVGR